MAELQEVVAQFAGHFGQGGSDKVWGAAYDKTGLLVTVWGRRGAALQRGEKQFATEAEAAKQYQKKLGEKVSEGYVAVPFDDAQYGIPAFGRNAVLATPVVAKAASLPAYTVSHVLPLDQPALQAAAADPRYGVQEKVNGERTVVAYDGTQLTVYNRRGVMQSTVPAAALALTSLGVPFALDGERMTGMDAGSYVIFDLLAWEGEDVRYLPYAERISLLAAQLSGSGLCITASPTYQPTGSPQLALLTVASDAATAQSTITAVEAAGGEGVIVRELAAAYVSGDTRTVRKFKFRADLDAIVIGVKPGVATGSVQLGLIRPTDGKLIPIGNVRSGLRDCDINRLAAMLAAGEQPVLTVGYLPIRTVGIQLVEPTTSIAALRNDKLAAECLTDQFGPAKAALVAGAQAILTQGLGRLHGRPLGGRSDADQSATGYPQQPPDRGPPARDPGCC